MIDKGTLITILSTNFVVIVSMLLKVIINVNMIPKIRDDLNLAWNEIRKQREEIDKLKERKNG